MMPQTAYGPRGDDLARLVRKIERDPQTKCWLWRGAHSRDGYGNFRVGGKTLLAHRVSYERLRCKIPDGFHIDHLCRRPSCVNPAHLEAVPPAENTARGISRNGEKVACVHGHPLNEANTRVCRSTGKRICRPCMARRMRELRKERRGK